MVGTLTWEFLSDLNWLAVVVATLAWFAYGAIYYAPPVMGNRWQKATKVTLGENYRPPPSLFIITLLAYLGTTVVIGLLVAQTGVHDIGDGLGLGSALGVGFGLLPALVVQLYEQKGSSYWLISGMFALISWMGVTALLAVWD
jgi:hypothetical protein